jgi:hypothetical protein
MELQLGIYAFHACQCRNGCDLSALDVQVVAAEDVSEQVFFQERINNGDE